MWVTPVADGSPFAQAGLKERITAVVIGQRMLPGPRTRAGAGGGIARTHAEAVALRQPERRRWIRRPPQPLPPDGHADALMAPDRPRGLLVARGYNLRHPKAKSSPQISRRPLKKVNGPRAGPPIRASKLCAAQPTGMVPRRGPSHRAASFLCPAAFFLSFFFFAFFAFLIASSRASFSASAAAAASLLRRAALVCTRPSERRGGCERASKGAEGRL